MNEAFERKAEEPETQEQETEEPTPATVRFREMILGDIPRICEIERECFPVPWTAGAFRNELLHNQFAHYVVMLWRDEVIGYGGMWTIMDEAHVTNIALIGRYRGRKLGDRLLRELLVRAAARGMKRITLEVRVSNTIAQRLYRKYGFRAEGVRPGYYTDNGEDALIMWADLPFADQAT